MSKTFNRKISRLLAQAENQDAAESSVAKATREFSTIEQANENFADVHRKLLQIERWNEFSNISSFKLFDENNRVRPEKAAIVGDFIEVTLPGSGKSDWVKVIAISETQDEVVLTVQPSHNPTDAENKNSTSHFFIDDSTNNFCLEKSGKTINFYVIGLDEKTNVEETGGVLETARNFATANIGRFLGIQKTQWETFCENILKTDH